MNQTCVSEKFSILIFSAWKVLARRPRHWLLNGSEWLFFCSVGQNSFRFVVVSVIVIVIVMVIVIIVFLII